MGRKSEGKTPDHIRRTNGARSAAIKRLIEAHPIEWRHLYTEEAMARGVTPRAANVDQKIAQLEARLKELRETYPQDDVFPLRSVDKDDD